MSNILNNHVLVIKTIRKFLGLSQKDFANFVDTPQSTYSKIENKILAVPLELTHKIVEKTNINRNVYFAIYDEVEKRQTFLSPYEVYELLSKLNISLTPTQEKAK